jgi:PAS domain S-box-containing protein
MDRATRYTAILFCAFAFPVLYIVSRYNYNLFHGLADIFTIVIASTVFVLAWNARESIDNDYLLYVGIAFLFFAFLDLFHVLGNKNMGVFPQYGNLGPALYIASRYVLSISLVTAPLFINRKLKVAPVFAAYSLVTLLVLLSIFYWHNFPACFVEGVGLTAFKVVSDYIICLILLGALVLLFLNRRSFDARVFRLLAASILLSIATGLAFTLYADPFGVTNAIGHFFQIISFYLIYLAVIETGLTKPQNILFRKLKQSEEKYRNLFENMADEVHFWQLVRDEAGNIRTWRLVDVNPPTLKTWGRQSVEEIRGMTTDEIFGTGATEHYMPVVQKIFAEGVPHSFEHYFPNLDKHFRFTSVPLGEHFITTGADITAIKKIEEALRASEEKARNLITYAPTAIFEMDFNATRFLSVNEATCDLSGYTREELLAMSPLSLTDESSKGLFRDWARRKLSGEKVGDTGEYTVNAKDGRKLILAIRASALTYREGEPVTVLVIGHDITDRKRAEEALKKAHDELEIRVQERTSDLAEAIESLHVENIQRKQLLDTLRQSENQVRYFASQCLTAQETERKRVAGELHDSIAASIAAVRLRIERMAEENQRGLGSTDSLQEIASRVAQINTEVRRIMADLRPSILDDRGIIAAISWFCREYQKTYPQISVEKQIGIEEREVPDSLKTPIFRICQEAMNNSAKHSRGSLVNVSLQKNGERILLTLQDDGQGFDPEKVKKGMGLSTIKERAAFSGGSAEYQSEVGRGTTIRVSWPVQVRNVG